MKDYIFETRMEVRDYECDIEGIVNNANYLHYTEHTRHLFLQSLGLSFSKMHEKGVDAVVARMNLQFKAPLRCDDVFISRLALEKKGLRYIFHQDIYRASDNVMCLKSDVDIVCLINGKLGNSDDYDKAFARFLPNKE
ncbi:MAG: thioesterase family protein [Prevotella sp.]|nr:thioesterase family protein [Prevotella sp.]